MSTTTPPNLGIVITSPFARKVVYSSYIVLLVIAGAIQVAYAAIQLGQPVWLVAALAVLAYLGIPVGGLALVNSPSSAQSVYADPTTPTGGASVVVTPTVPVV